MSKKNILFIVLIVIAVGGILGWRFWLQKEAVIPPAPTAVSKKDDLNLITTKLAVISEEHEVLPFFIGEREITFSPDGRRVAYGAKRGEKHFVVVNGEEHSVYDWAGHITFSPDGKRLAYFAEKEGKQLTVLDGEEGPLFDSVGAPEFSPDSKHFAYIGRKGGKELIVFDNEEGPMYDYISSPPYIIQPRWSALCL